MSKDKIFVIGALFTSSLFCFIPGFIAGSAAIQNGPLPNQLAQSFIFKAITRMGGLDLFVAIFGLALSIYFRRQNPKKFQFAAASFTILLLGTTLSGLLSAWVEINYVQQQASANQRAMGYSAVQGIYVFSQLAAWLILLFVIFGRKFNPIEVTPNE